MLPVGNYDTHINIIDWKLSSIKDRENKLANVEDFLSNYSKMIPYSLYPSPIIMPLTNIDSSEFILINKCIDNMEPMIEEHENKITEFMGYKDKIADTYNTEKARRFFDYEIRDAVSAIVKDTYVTNAWVKMYELLHTYKLFDNDASKINTFHICEHPGAFIYSIAEYIKRNTAAEHNFRFQSLKPKKGTGSKIFSTEKGLLSKHSDKLDYASDGDITNIDNIKYYIDKYRSKKWDLITSDCGLDCSDDFNKQETVLAPIYGGALITALGIGSKGSNYVYKIFSFHTKYSIELLAISKQYYENVFITRTLTTKSTSGEIYVVCINQKRALTDNEIEDLISKYNKGSFMDKIPKNMSDDIIKYNDLLTKRRILSINFIIFRYNNIEFVHKNKVILDYVKESVDYYTNFFLRYIKLK